MWEEHLRPGYISRAKSCERIPSELRSIFLPEPWRHQRSRLCGADSLAGAGLWKYDVPEVVLDWRIKAHESPVALLRKDVTKHSATPKSCR